VFPFSAAKKTKPLPLSENLLQYSDTQSNSNAASNSIRKQQPWLRHNQKFFGIIIHYFIV